MQVIGWPAGLRLVLHVDQLDLAGQRGAPQFGRQLRGPGERRPGPEQHGAVGRDQIDPARRGQGLHPPQGIAQGIRRRGIGMSGPAREHPRRGRVTRSRQRLGAFLVETERHLLCLLCGHRGDRQQRVASQRGNRGLVSHQRSHHNDAGHDQEAYCQRPGTAGQRGCILGRRGHEIQRQHEKCRSDRDENQPFDARQPGDGGDVVEPGQQAIRQQDPRSRHDGVAKGGQPDEAVARRITMKLVPHGCHPALRSRFARRQAANGPKGACQSYDTLKPKHTKVLIKCTLRPFNNRLH